LDITVTFLTFQKTSKLIKYFLSLQ